MTKVTLYLEPAVALFYSRVAPRARRDDGIAAVPAGEAFVTGVSFIIAFFVLFSFIFPVHFGNSS